MQQRIYDKDDWHIDDIWGWFIRHVESFNDFEIVSNPPCPQALNTAYLHMHFISSNGQEQCQSLEFYLLVLTRYLRKIIACINNLVSFGYCFTMVNKFIVQSLSFAYYNWLIALPRTCTGILCRLPLYFRNMSWCFFSALLESILIFSYISNILFLCLAVRHFLTSFVFVITWFS